ncbi:MAG: hypothetical protein QOG07_3126 [Pseudonocardiales bacterium]|nr:hypothetical protein [Pseudonocardiales bacterium]
MVQPGPDPDSYPPIDPREPVPDDPGELSPDTPETLPPPPVEPMPGPDDPDSVPAGPSGRLGQRGASTGACMDDNSRSSAYSTSSFQETVDFRSRRSRGVLGCGRTVLKPTANR